MKKKSAKNMQFEKLIRAGFPAPGLDSKADAHILARIRERTRQTDPKPALGRKIRLYFRYAPLSAAAAILVILCAAVLPVFLISRSGQEENVPFTVISNLTGENEKTGKKLLLGDKMKHGSRFSTSADEKLSLQQGDSTGILLFADSVLTKIAEGPLSGGIFRLEKGSLYINRTGSDRKDTLFRVCLNNYEFTLAGTRVFISCEPDSSVRLVCYDGNVLIDRKDSESDTIDTAHRDEKVIIHADGSLERFGREQWSAEEYLLDAQIRTVLPFRPVYTIPDRVIRDASEPGNTGSAGSRTENAVPVPDWTISFIGTIAGSGEIGSSGKTARFFASAAGGDYTYFLSAKKLTLLQNGVLENILTFTDEESFINTPVDAGSVLCLVSDRRIYLLNKEQTRIIRSIPVPEKGSVSPLYSPVYRSNSLYIPVINSGYCRLDLAGDNSRLELVVPEAFPVTPAIDHAQFYFGAFYKSHLSCYSTQFEPVWNFRLPGTVFSDFIVWDGIVSIYVVEEGQPKIITVQAGRRTGEWKLNTALQTSIRQSGRFLYAVDEKGNLFCLDTKTGKRGEEIHLAGPSTDLAAIRNPVSEWKGRLFCGTSSGKLVVYDMENGRNLETIVIDENERFYAAPLVTGDTIFLTADSGRVFAAIRSGK
ncbi:MAG: PQQ-binding-like beta-propeller repeat protein [Spirochaetales bacterium]|nr:PQQ-binding-like beta-propeller repeat protein [Spirochaetales bacterium]